MHSKHADSLEKTQILGKMKGRRRSRRQGEMVGWQHQVDGHELEQVLGVGDGEGSLACCSLWCCKETDTTDRLN